MGNFIRKHVTERINSATYYTLERRRVALLRGVQDARLEAGMTLEELADAMGCSVSHCNNEETGAREDITPGIIKVDRLCRASKSIKPIEALARVNNCAIVPLPIPTPDNKDILRDASRILAETGDAIAEMGNALVDGKVTEDELCRCTQQIHEAVEALLRAEANLVAKSRRKL